MGKRIRKPPKKSQRERRKKHVRKQQPQALKQNAPTLLPTTSAQLRERRNLKVVDPSELVPPLTPPNCPHGALGPCLLFEDPVGNRWFSCAVYRSKECPFRVRVSSDRTLDAFDEVEPEKFDYRYNKLSESFQNITASGSSPYWCSRCFDYVQVPHRDPVEGPLCEPKPPFDLVQAIQDDKGHAQYWFSTDTLRVLHAAIRKQQVDAVLCIGAPTFAEFLRRKAPETKVFVLDYDHRFTWFYETSQFAHYSLLSNHFYEEAGRERLLTFLRSCKSLAVVCDPPDINRTFGTILALPIFVGKHVLKDPAHSMIDFKVTYTNHKTYGKADKSIVRIFTDFPANSFELPTHLGYRFCTICDRYVAAENKHCNACGVCPSKVAQSRTSMR
ncbi:Protein F33A8.4 [Aphelenchoides avenae]|nr:Protein F33A8.4 [Aphelenchus avenae]